MLTAVAIGLAVMGGVAASFVFFQARAAELGVAEEGPPTAPPVAVAAATTKPDLVLAPSPTVAPTATSTPASTPTPTPTPPPTLADVVEEVSSGVVRVLSSSCSGTGSEGTGFLIGPDLVATVAHVVDDSYAVGVQQGDEQHPAKVVGYDYETELALLQTTRPLHGHVFSFTPRVRVGQDVAVLGYPSGLKLSVSRGIVSGLDREVQLQDGPLLTGILQTDAAINPGNSGGPLIDDTGAVIGLADAVRRDVQGIAWAVPAEDAEPVLRGFVDAPTGPADVDCQGLVVVADVALADGENLDQVAGVVTTFDRYFIAINRGDFAAAFAQLSTPLQNGTRFEAFRQGVRTSFDVNVTLHSLQPRSAGEMVVHVTFRSYQDATQGPRPGEECSDWSLDYTLVDEDGTWRIDDTTGHGGGEGSVPCPEES